MKNRKICIVCGRVFACPPSDKTVTCGPECRRKYAAMRRDGKPLSAETRAKISAAAKGRDMSGIQVVATKAALISPKSGPFETNISSKDWILKICLVWSRQRKIFIECSQVYGRRRGASRPARIRVGRQNWMDRIRRLLFSPGGFSPGDFLFHKHNQHTGYLTYRHKIIS